MTFSHGKEIRLLQQFASICQIGGDFLENFKVHIVMYLVSICILASRLEVPVRSPPVSLGLKESPVVVNVRQAQPGDKPPGRKVQQERTDMN